jgi:hypothetical protein
MIEMIIWLWGLFGVLTGTLRIFGNITFRGMSARGVGILFMIPFPVSLYIPKLLRQYPIQQTDFQFFYLLAELLIILFFVGGGITLGWVWQRRQERRIIGETVKSSD